MDRVYDGTMSQTKHSVCPSLGYEVFTKLVSDAF